MKRKLLIEIEITSPEMENAEDRFFADDVKAALLEHIGLIDLAETAFFDNYRLGKTGTQKIKDGVTLKWRATKI